jgi:ribonuclease PH
MFSSCLICLHEVPILDENYDEDDDEEYDDNMVKEMKKNIFLLNLLF